MLQQTRVAVVKERYGNFLQRFPDVRSLARAPLSRVLAEWSGLGYYRRARNLHAAARMMTRRGGCIPRSAAELRELPGIGRYTAAAISSIAFGEAQAAVDGNVERVVARLLGSEADPWQATTFLLDRVRPGDFNQAMMELGATVCLPRQPRCEVCPMARFCAHPKDRHLRKARRCVAPERIKAKQAYVFSRHADKILLRRRPAAASLMPGMWELPRTRRKSGPVKLRLRHSITNTDYMITVFLRARSGRAEQSGVWQPVSTLHRLPLTGLTRKILRRLAPETNL